jgi:hypothetical protein
VASSLLRGPSPKRPCTATDGGQDSSCVASVASSLMGPEAPIQGEGAEDVVEIGTTSRVDGEVYHPSLEMSGGEDQDLLQHLFANMVVEHPVSPTLSWGYPSPGMQGPLEVTAWRRLVPPTLPWMPCWLLVRWCRRQHLLP